MKKGIGGRARGREASRKKRKGRQLLGKRLILFSSFAGERGLKIAWSMFGAGNGGRQREKKEVRQICCVRQEELGKGAGEIRSKFSVFVFWTQRSLRGRLSREK